MKGYLSKKGGGKGKERNLFKGGRRNWKKRWFVLEGNTLTYYEGEPVKNVTGEVLGQVTLDTLLSVDKATNKETERPFTFVLRSADRDLLVAAETERELSQWLMAITWRKSVNDFMGSPAQCHTKFDSYQIGHLWKLGKDGLWSRLVVLLRDGLLNFGSSMASMPEEYPVHLCRVAEEEQSDGAGGGLRQFCFGVFPPAGSALEPLHFSASNAEEVHAWIENLHEVSKTEACAVPAPVVHFRPHVLPPSMSPSFGAQFGDELSKKITSKMLAQPDEPAADIAPSRKVSAYWGQSLSELIHNPLNKGLSIPLVADRCISYLRSNSNEAAGLFDRPDIATVNTLKEQCQRGTQELTFTSWVAPNVVAMLLKEFLKELAEPLFTYERYSDLIVCPLNNLIQLKSLIDTLPRPHFDLAKALFELLAALLVHSAQNRLTADVIAENFGNIVLRPSAGDPSPFAVPLVRCVVTNCEYLFPMKEKASTQEDHVSLMGRMSSMHDDHDDIQSPDNTDYGDREERMQYQAEMKERDMKSEMDAKDIVIGDANEAGIAEVKCGTVDRLVERLTYEYYPDNFFQFVFLLTYRSFTNPSELLRKLIDRFNIAPPADELDSRVKYFIEYKQKPIRLRVVNVLRQWVDKYFYFDDFDKDMKQEFFSFVDIMVAGSGMTTAARQLNQSLTKKLMGARNAARDAQFSQEPPKPHVPANLTLENITFMQLDDLEIARQLTIIESDLYRRIAPKECLGQAWNKKTRAEIAPNITAMVDWFNKVSRWVAATILGADLEHKDRKAVMEKFISIADKCRHLNNYNAVIEIVSGLHNAAVHRLKKTWEAMPKKVMENYHNMDTLMAYEHNYKNYRENLKKQDPPIVPYLGVYLTDLTFIEDGNPDLIDGLISFTKRQKLAVVIRDIQQYQQLPYNLRPVDEIRQFLVAQCAEAFTGITEDELYKRSLEKEPRT